MVSHCGMPDYVKVTRSEEFPYKLCKHCLVAMGPFICIDLSNLLKGVMIRIVKNEKLGEAAKYTDDHVRLTLDEENVVTAHKVEIGFAAEKELKRLVNRKNISKKDALGVLSDAKSGIMM